MIKGLLLACVLMVGLLIAVKVITDELAYQLESQTDLEQETIDTINNIRDNYIDVNWGIIILVIFFIITCVPIILVSKFSNIDLNHSDVIGDDIFPIKHERIKEDAVTILKRRYANGEINSYEYTEKMSRL